MSLDQLITTSSTSANATTTTGGFETHSARTSRSMAWLLPLGLILGFISVFALLFGERLLPAIEVSTAQVITIRASSDPAATSAGISTKYAPVAKSEGSVSDQSKIADESDKITIHGKMLFQASGWVEPSPYITFVPSLINGVIDQVYVLEGQHVKKGQLLATLVDDEAQLELQEAETKMKSQKASIVTQFLDAEIAQAEIDAAIQKIEALNALHDDSIDHLTRLEKLPNEAIPAQQVVQARLAKIRRHALVAEAEAGISQLKTRIQQVELKRIAMRSKLEELKVARDTARLKVERTRIVSPMDGMVLNLHAAPGKKRIFNMDDPHSAVIASLYDPNELRARIDVPLTEASQLMVGQLVELTCDILPNTVFHGKVTRIGGEADIQRNTLQAKVKILKPDHHLRPEMLVRGKFYSSPAQHSAGGEKPNQSAPTNSRLALYVPEVALINDASVWVVSTTNTAEQRKITLSDESRDGFRRIVSGLHSGESVILPPHTSLQEGARVKMK